ncbi:MAG: DUF2306 domain-containing protein [Alphaproteobacteria bacterium]|nr:DUF2306 domain-containing protein [Alphaproteobacteria bacterium]
MSRSPQPARAAWTTPSLLLALTLVPVAAGAARLVWLATGEVRPDSARFAAAPAVLVLHILCACAFCVLGAFQFTPGGSRRWPGWHRAAGRLLAPLGLLAAILGLWATVLYPPGVNDGQLLYGLRLVFGSAMAASLLLGLDAIRRRDFASHVDWMTRGYAIGLGAGTQVVVFLPWALLVGPTDQLSRALLMGAGWVINLAIAEGLIRRRRVRPAWRVAGL